MRDACDDKQGPRASSCGCARCASGLPRIPANLQRGDVECHQRAFLPLELQYGTRSRSQSFLKDLLRCQLTLHARRIQGRQCAHHTLLQPCDKHLAVDSTLVPFRDIHILQPSSCTDAHLPAPIDDPSSLDLLSKACATGREASQLLGSHNQLCCEDLG
jgi:hypothetical protein